LLPMSAHPDILARGYNPYSTIRHLHSTQDDI
jgi:hypothetical protein